MRLLLHTLKGLVRTYRIDTNNGSITGWYLGNWHINQLNLPKDIGYDCHFTYPKGGKYHVSIKCRESNPEEYINVYSDIVTVKEITNGVAAKSVFTREQFENNKWNIIGHMVPAFDPLPLDSIDFFQFPSLGFNIFNGDFSGSNIINNIVPEDAIKSDDLIIDVRLLDKYSFSCWGTIRGIGEQDKSTVAFKDWEHSERIEEKNNHVVTQIVCGYKTH
jgi:hypothetical protein